jgi:hypothetical protein
MKYRQRRKPSVYTGEQPRQLQKVLDAEPATRLQRSKQLGTFGPASGKRSLKADPAAVSAAFASLQKALQKP